MNIVLATRNLGKIAEMKALLEGLPVTLLTVDDFPGAEEVEEDKPTLEGNALKKASYLHSFTGLPALADDTGLEVTALGGRPGVYSARYAGPEANPVANRALLLEELSEATDRSACFRTVLAFVKEGNPLYFEGTCCGTIGIEQRGEGGFGYDALFIPEGLACTFAEMEPTEKNNISHRGRALKAFKNYLSKLLTHDSF